MFGNLLAQALSVIPSQSFTYYKFKAVTVNEIGNKQIQYESPIELQGSVQAISQDMYDKLGLDWSKKYISIHSSTDIRNTDNEQPVPDKIVWQQKEYLVTKVTNWYGQDGWTRIIAVEQTVDEEENNEEQEEKCLK